MQLFRFQKAYSPLLVSNTRSGTLMLPEVAARMTDAGRAMPDTDWHLSRILDLPVLESAAVISANLSRYIVDLNRPADQLMGLGGDAIDQDPLVALRTLAGEAIYRPGEEPDAAEIQRRLEHYYHPFYRQIGEELTRMTARFGRVLLIDVHHREDRGQAGAPSPGILVNLDSDRGCDPELRRLLDQIRVSPSPLAMQIVDQPPAAVVGRFGHLPAVDALEIVLDPAAYLESDGFGMDFELVAELNESLEPLLVALMKWAESRVP